MLQKEGSVGDPVKYTYSFSLYIFFLTVNPFFQDLSYYMC